eukprot:scaffold412547_cov47-Prasinocladus_malaysianus.AAC.1
MTNQIALSMPICVKSVDCNPPNPDGAFNTYCRLPNRSNGNGSTKLGEPCQQLVICQIVLPEVISKRFFPLLLEGHRPSG